MNKQTLLLPVLGAAFIGSTMLGVGYARAQDTANPTTSIVQKIAQKFNLKEADVQSVFDEEHTARHAQMQAEVDKRLTQAVTDGKITQAQKQAILAKFQEMKNNKPAMESFKNMTAEQRKAQMETKRTELESWAKSNGLTMEIVQEFMGHGKSGRGFMMKIKHTQ